MVTWESKEAKQKPKKAATSLKYCTCSKFDWLQFVIALSVYWIERKWKHDSSQEPYNNIQLCLKWEWVKNRRNLIQYFSLIYWLVLHSVIYIFFFLCRWAKGCENISICDCDSISIILQEIKLIKIELPHGLLWIKSGIGTHTHTQILWMTVGNCHYNDL